MWFRFSKARQKTTFRLLLAALLLLGLPLAHAYDDRVALVIGNDAYPTEPLKNASNDARAVAKALSDLGFKVVVKTNADINTMRSAAVEFAKILDGATAAVFYYAGHGIQYRDKNYLVPVDAKLTSEPEIVYNALEVGQLLESMDDAKVKFKFIILDACRNNPFSNVFSSTGLAKISKVPPGTIISYAAAAGAVALDGDGDNGLYTKHLLAEIRNPANQAGPMFQRVQTAVAQESGNKQLPELYSTPLPRGTFYFAERGAAAAAAAGGASSDAQISLEREFWSSVKDSRNPKDYQAYLEQFPSGTFAGLARNRIDSLKQAPAQIAAAPAPVPTSPAGSTMPNAAAESESSPAGAAPLAGSPPAIKAAAVPARKAEPASASAPIQLATTTGTSETRGLDNNKAAASAPAAPSAAPQVVAPAPAAAAPLLLASVSPEQRSALPPAPAAAQMLTGLIEYPDGARYNGEYREGKDRIKILNGRGEFISKSFHYNGEFKDGRKHGRGIYEWANGDKFDGDFAEDRPSGKGVWQFAGGDRYEGEIVDGAIVGKGVFVSKNGDKIIGSFIDGKASGRVSYIFANGDKYEGEMVQGRISGKGVYLSKNGDRTESTFVDGNANGKGIYYFANGDRYEGDIRNGSLTGQGIYYYSNGLRAEGEYANGALKGKGAFYFNDGSWFEGVFEDGLKKAKGMMIYKDGTKRAAEMIDGTARVIQ
ncbi:MAG TPA: caspase family protein [Usitatibacteraceae bacterium]